MQNRVKVFRQTPNQLPAQESNQLFDFVLAHNSYEELKDQLHSPGFRLLKLGQNCLDITDQASYECIDVTRQIHAVYLPYTLRRFEFGG
jgi:hypothetical protein